MEVSRQRIFVRIGRLFNCRTLLRFWLQRHPELKAYRAGRADLRLSCGHHKRQAQKENADMLVEKVFGGSVELLFASVLREWSLSGEELARRQALVEEYEV